jgi:hypothetical protein
MNKRAERKNVGAGKEGDLGSDDKMLERGFERWLNGQLHRIYDPVLSEAVPDEIARLLDGFDAAPELKSPNDDERKP